MPDAVERVRAFVAAMTAARADFVIQLGDFCQPHPRNQAVLAAWNAFAGPRYHVLGNHDMDGGYKPEQTVAFYAVPARYYAFTAGPLRGLVLDGNEPGGKGKGYKRFIGPEQLAWLERELAASDRPVAVFVHQPLFGNDGGCVENSAAVRAVLEKAQAATPGRVAGVYGGHLHVDAALAVNGVNHVQINSASYWWLENAAAARETYPPEVHKQHPYLRCVAAYRDPLWALVTLDFENGTWALEGRSSAWVGPDPWERGERTTRPREQVCPRIADRNGKLVAAAL